MKINISRFAIPKEPQQIRNRLRFLSFFIRSFFQQQSFSGTFSLTDNSSETVIRISITGSSQIKVFKISPIQEKAWLRNEPLGISIFAPSLDSNQDQPLLQLTTALKNFLANHTQLTYFRAYFQYSGPKKNIAESNLSYEESDPLLNQAAFLLLNILKDDPLRVVNVKHFINGRFETWRSLQNAEFYPWLGFTGQKLNAAQVKQSWQNYADQYLRINKPLTLYLHFPHCTEICNFCHCSAVKFQKKSDIDNYFEMVMQELGLYAPILKKIPLSAVYLGGGTPSLLSEKNFSMMARFIRQNFSVQKNLLFSFEGNPDSTTARKIDAVSEFLPVNRVSLGLQSVDPRVQELSNRFNKKEKILRLMDIFRLRNIRSVNIDVMTGLNGQDLSAFRNDLKFVASFKPSTISMNTHGPFQIGNAGKNVVIDRRQVVERTKQAAWGNVFLRRNQFGSFANSFETDILFNRLCVLFNQNDLALLGIGVSSYSYVPGELFYETPMDIPQYLSGNFENYMARYSNPSEEIHSFLVKNLLYGIDLKDLRRRFSNTDQVLAQLPWGLLEALRIFRENDFIKPRTDSEAKIQLARYLMAEPSIQNYFREKYMGLFDKDFNYIDNLQKIFAAELMYLENKL